MRPTAKPKETSSTPLTCTRMVRASGPWGLSRPPAERRAGHQECHGANDPNAPGNHRKSMTQAVEATNRVWMQYSFNRGSIRR